jgi:hypothetical protein
LYSAYVRACALLDSSSPMTSIRMGSIGSSGRSASLILLRHEGHRALFGGGKGQATRGAALPNAGNRELPADGFRDAGQARFVQKRTASE